MSVQLTIDLPDDAFSVLKTSPAEFARQMRLAAAVKWLEAGMISQSKAAELAGVSRHALLAALARFGVSPFQVTPTELEDEAGRG